MDGVDEPTHPGGTAKPTAKSTAKTIAKTTAKTTANEPAKTSGKATLQQPERGHFATRS
jgi:hypothetical protein